MIELQNNYKSRQPIFQVTKALFYVEIYALIQLIINKY